MKKITTFFWICSGADPDLLAKCPTESGKYVGIGATIFFTGLFAALAGGYALYTVFDNAWVAAIFGILWGMMIFNLDRYIVSSMRKEGKIKRELAMASPRLVLAVIISLVIATPLELKIFEKEIEPELIVMEQQAYARQEEGLRARFRPAHDSVLASVELLKAEIVAKSARRDELVRLAQEEADGTGGSRRRNLGPIYKVKKADAEATERELAALTTGNTQQIQLLEKIMNRNDSLMAAEYGALEKKKRDGPAARMEALSRLTDQSSAIRWAHWFIILLFVAIETAPVVVKLISSKGPYDNLLKIEEHNVAVLETETIATRNAQAKESTSTLPQRERDFAAERLDASLK